MVLQKDAQNTINGACEQRGSFKEKGTKMTLKIRNKHNEKMVLGGFDALEAQ